MADHTKHPHEQHAHDKAPGSNPEVSHERRDVNVFQISAFGIGLLLGCIVVVFAMWAMFDYLYLREDSKNAGNPNAAMMNQKQTTPPEPHLQPEPGEPGPKEQLKDLRADEDAILSSYGWLDPNKGTVRIPIDLAIDMVAQKGLSSKPGVAGADGGFRTIPEDSSGGRTLEKISQ